VDLERDPFSLVSTIEELLGRKNSGCSLEIREYGRWDPALWPRGTLYPQKLALIVRSPTKATEFFLIDLPSGLFLRVFLRSPARTHPCNLRALPIPLYLIMIMRFDEECKLRSSSLCSFQPPVISSLLGPNALLISLLWSALNMCSRNVTKFHIQRVKV
jgi:hypothetical protein